MKLRSTLMLLAFAVMSAAVRPCALAQATISFAQLNGTVQDTTGRVVAGASVTLRDLGTNGSYNAVCNSNGYYVVPSLSPGQYELTVQYTGFSKYVQTGIALSVGQTATVDVTLKVASVGESVVVTGEAPVVEPTRSETSQVIDAVQIQGLPTTVVSSWTLPC